MENIDLPNTRETKYMPEWISIKEKTPEKYEMVLVYCPLEVTKIRPCQFSNWEGAEQLGITHWMRLPEPPNILIAPMKKVSLEEFKKDYPDVEC